MPENPAKSQMPPGERVLAGLTDAQLCTLLSVAAEAGALRALDDRLRAADPDLANTVARLLNAGGPAAAVTRESETSDARAREIWQEHWREWESHVAELGDEEGDYANHDEPWHPPYFDPYALAEDLEAVAAKLAPDLERAFTLIDEPELFDRTLGAIDRGIDSYPDSMQMNEDVCVLGSQATTCALRWIWLALAAQSEPGRLLAERLWKLANECEHVAWNVEAAVRFLGELPAEVCREIHAWLRTPDMARAAEDIRSLWHRASVAYDQRFDPAAHLRTCDEQLERDWRSGQPLIDAALARSDFAAAESFVARTVSSLLRFGYGDEPWQPEQPLWEARRYGRMPEEERAFLELLGRWEEIAAAGGNRERAAGCRLQRVLWTSADDWPAVLAAFADFRAHGGAPSVEEALFGAWRAWEVEACSIQAEMHPPNRGESWMGWLLDARRDPAAHRADFVERLEAWLDGCREHAAFFGRHWRELALLTRSLPHHEQIKSEFPAFSTHVLLPPLQVSGKRAQSVREALGSLELDPTRFSSMAAWKDHLHTLVPSPASASSLYREQANWMKALSELNRPRYDTLLARWRAEFSRRRNLWKDMQACGCPGC